MGVFTSLPLKHFQNSLLSLPMSLSLLVSGLYKYFIWLCLFCFHLHHGTCFIKKISLTRNVLSRKANQNAHVLSRLCEPELSKGTCVLIEGFAFLETAFVALA
jgi:hypothetical protein